MAERISDAEHAVMEVLWDESPLTAQDVAERIPPERDWSRQYRQDAARPAARQEYHRA